MDTAQESEELIAAKALQKGTCRHCGRVVTITDNLVFHTLTGCVSCDAELVQVEEFTCYSEPLFFDVERMAEPTEGEIMKTLSDLCVRHDVEIPEHLVADAEIPVLTGPQRQGDVIIVPMVPGKVEGLTDIPAEGIPVVRGEAGGNTHLLVGGGQFAPSRGRDQTLGTLSVTDPADPAYLLHPEHGGSGFGPGMYIVRRQREQADVERLVSD